jgi:rRNA-processing protein FCF1
MKCYCFTGKNMDFEVIVDEQFMDMCLDDQLDPIENKNVLSIVNDFQDGKSINRDSHP